MKAISGNYLSDIATGLPLRAASSIASVTSTVRRPSRTVVWEQGVPAARESQVI